jgi:hypothetical protein
MFALRRSLMMQIYHPPCAHVDGGQGRLSAALFVNPTKQVEHASLPAQLPFHLLHIMVDPAPAIFYTTELM